MANPSNEQCPLLVLGYETPLAHSNVDPMSISPSVFIRGWGPSESGLNPLKCPVAMGEKQGLVVNPSQKKRKKGGIHWCQRYVNLLSRRSARSLDIPGNWLEAGGRGQSQAETWRGSAAVYSGCVVLLKGTWNREKVPKCLYADVEKRTLGGKMQVSTGRLREAQKSKQEKRTSSGKVCRSPGKVCSVSKLMEPNWLQLRCSSAIRLSKRTPAHLRLGAGGGRTSRTIGCETQQYYNCARLRPAQVSL